MIPTQNIVAWGNVVPWAEQRQVEQDLIISRALVEIFSDDMLRDACVTAQQAALPEAHALLRGYRLVRTSGGPIGPLLDLRVVLDPGWDVPGSIRAWSRRSFVFGWKDGSPIRLKVEINTRWPSTARRRIENPWFSGEAVFSREEMLATKLRALLQRDQGRDLYDLAHALEVFENRYLPNGRDVRAVSRPFRPDHLPGPGPGADVRKLANPRLLLDVRLCCRLPRRKL